MHLKNFPKTPYFFGNKDLGQIDFPNLSLNVRLGISEEDDSSFYRSYTVQDGQRPDVVSTILYGTPEYYWTFFLINPQIREKGWPLTSYEFEKKIQMEMPGQVLTFFGESSPGVHAIVGTFPIGSRARGSISGASGIVYRRDPLRGQIFVTQESGTFIANEDIVDTLEGEPQYRLTSRIACTADMGIDHYEDADGLTIDVDYRYDFRGKAEGETLGGSFDNPEFPDPNGVFRPVTYRELYERENEEKSTLRVFTPGTIPQVVALYKKSLNR
jgi:hypothetical protein